MNLLRRKSAESSITARQAAPGIVKLRQLRNILLWRQLPPEIHLTENTPGGNPRPSCTTGLFKDQFRTAQSSNSMASTEREPITGVWGRSPQRGSRRQSPGWGVRGRSPLKLNAFLFLHVQIYCTQTECSCTPCPKNTPLDF